MADYDINYNDERFQKVESEKNTALTENEKLYGDMVNSSDKYYQAQIDASKEWADKQTQLQQEKTDFAIEQIEQQKDQAKKDYTKEQSGAYVDWRKQSNEYGSEAEKMASAGLTDTGYSESSQVSMYNTYQNRVATARESFNRAILNYNNSIKDAQLQNNSTLAEIAYQALQQQLELSLQGFQYKNNLLLEQANKKLEIESLYHTRWQDVLDQINHENSLAEQIRQFNEKMAEDKRQYNETLALQKAQLEEQKRQYNETMAYNKSRSSGGSSGSSSSSSSSSKSNKISNNSSSSSKISNTGSKSSSGLSGLNAKSVLDLGEGPLNADAVAKKVASGEVTATQKGNQIYVSKNTKSSGTKVKSTDVTKNYLGQYSAVNKLLGNNKTTASKKTAYWSWLK